jgi:hypothetical protein
LLVAHFQLPVPVAPLEVDVEHGLARAGLGRELRLEFERRALGQILFHAPGHAPVCQHAADDHVARGGDQVGAKLVVAQGGLEGRLPRLGRDFHAPQKERVCERERVVEGLGEVEAEALEEVGLERH